MIGKTFAAAAVAAIGLGIGLAGADDIVAMPALALDWETTPEGVAFAALEGDRFAEPYMAMVRLPAGLASPPHVKTAAMFGVVVTGTMTHALYDLQAGAVAGAPDLPPGSYYMVPAGAPHVSSCVSADDCVTFLYQPGSFDFLPVAQ